MVPLLLQAALTGPLRRSPGRTLLAVMAIALGVALGLAIYLINRTAADEISLAARSLYGTADLAVQGGAAGLDEQLYPQVARLPGVAVASPVVEVTARLAEQRGALQLLGVDGFRSRLLQPAFAAAIVADGQGGVELDPQAILLSASAARELQVQVGDFLDFQVGARVQRLKIAAVLAPAVLQEPAGVIDIATAQWRFERLGQLSRIDLRLVSGANPQQIGEAIQALLPADARVITPGEASDDALRLSRAYRSNLSALALVALFTGGFFVYSTQSLAALRRRREFALLHALGVTRSGQLGLMLAAGGLVGLIGAALGVVLGVMIAQIALTSLGGDLGAGYFRNLDADVQVRGWEVAVFAGMGVLVALAGALRPALDAARIATASALKSGDVASGEVRMQGGLVMALLALAAVAVCLPPLDGLPLPGYVAIALLLIATVIATPAAVQRLLGMLPNGGRVAYQIALAQLIGTARYATLSVSAIIVSFSLMTSMAIMVTSFRVSLDEWTQKLLPADVYLRMGDVGESAYLEADALARLAELDSVQKMQFSRFATVQLSAQQPAVTLIARNMENDAPEATMWMLSSAKGVPPASRVPLWINEAAADLYQLRAGDELDFSLAGQQVWGSVRGIWRDYAFPQGAIVMQYDHYQGITGDTAANTVWFWLRPGVSAATFGKTLTELLPAGGLEISTPRELRERSLATFDRTFAITYLLELIAVVIGLSGVAAGISAQVLARRSEFGALRHLGFTRAQVATMLGIEGALLGTLGVVMGLLSGVVVALILIYVVNRQSFHWSMDISLPWELLLGLSAALIVAAALIAILSGRQAMSGSVLRAVKEDW